MTESARGRSSRATVDAPLAFARRVLLLDGVDARAVERDEDPVGLGVVEPTGDRHGAGGEHRQRGARARCAQRGRGERGETHGVRAVFVSPKRRPLKAGLQGRMDSRCGSSSRPPLCRIRDHGNGRARGTLVSSVSARSVVRLGRRRVAGEDARLLVKSRCRSPARRLSRFVRAVQLPKPAPEESDAGGVRGRPPHPISPKGRAKGASASHDGEGFEL